LLLYWFPGLLRVVLWTAFLGTLLVMLATVWIFTYQASLSAGKPLMVELPPVIPALLPVLILTLMFFRDRLALSLCAVVWVLTALPVLAYLWLHPAELWSPRGMDTVVMLVPMSMLVVLALLPFQTGMDRRVAALQDERSTWQGLAERDALTGLYNRRAGEASLAAFLNRAALEGGVMLFDLDHFKGVNDTHGHDVGDEVLREVARRCQARLRHDDVLVRWGGEEFLAILHGGSVEVLARVAEDLRQVIAAETIGPVGTVTASFGVAGVRAREKAGDLLKRADRALYAAKRGGRDRVVRDG